MMLSIVLTSSERGSTMGTSVWWVVSCGEVWALVPTVVTIATTQQAAMPRIQTQALAGKRELDLFRALRMFTGIFSSVSSVAVSLGTVAIANLSVSWTIFNQLAEDL